MDDQDKKQGTLQLLRTALFGVGFIMVKDVPATTWVTVLTSFINWAQMAAFPLNGSAALPWKGTPIEPLSVALSYVTTSTLDVTHSMTSLIVVLAIAATWIGVFVFMAVHVGYNFVHEKAQNEGELRLLRAVALLSTTTLFLPFTSVVFRGIACPNEEWLNSGWSCDSGNRIVVAVILCVLLTIFACFSLFVAAVFIDRNPASESWSAKSHGRVHVAMLLVKLLLAFLYNTLPERVVGTGLTTAVLVASGLFWSYLTIRLAPHTHDIMNAIQVGFALAFTWLCVILAAAQIWPGYDMWLLVFGGTPLVFACGQVLARSYLGSVSRKPLEECRTMEELNIWARYRMQVYGALSKGADRKHQKNGGATAFSADDTNTANTNNGSTNDTANNIVATASAAMRRIASFTSATGRQQPQRAPSVVGGGSVMGGGRGSALAKTGNNQKPQDQNLDGSHQTEEEDALEAERTTLLQEAERGYRIMTNLFPDKELALVTAASFYEYHSPYHVDEATFLAMALRSSPSLDTSFLVYSRSRRLRESDGSGLSPIDRIIFDQKLREVRASRISAYRLLASVWETLAHTVPDLAALATASSNLDSAISRIDSLYKDLLNINPESPVVLRGYASYLMEMRNESSRAQELLNKADRVEDTSSRLRSTVLRHYVLGASQPRSSSLDENSAIVTISGYKQTLGEILRVSPSALRLFGYSSKSQLLGQNVNVLIPSPIREVHDQLLLRFRGKRSSSVVDQSRLMAAVRRDLSVTPVWITIMEAPPDEKTCEPRFTALFTEVACSEEVIFFSGAEMDYAIYGCSSGALRLLGLEGSMVMGDRPSMRNWFPSISPSYDPQDVPLQAGQIEWLRRAASRGEVNGDLGRLLGAHGGVGSQAMPASNSASMRVGPTPSRGMRASGPASGARILVAHRLLDLDRGSGIIPVADAASPLDDETSNHDGHDTDSDIDLGEDLVGDNDAVDSDANGGRSAVLVGQVQKVAIPGLAPFFVLTYREVIDDSSSFMTTNMGTAGNGTTSILTSTTSNKPSTRSSLSVKTRQTNKASSLLEEVVNEEDEEEDDDSGGDSRMLSSSKVEDDEQRRLTIDARSGSAESISRPLVPETVGQSGSMEDYRELAATDDPELKARTMTEGSGSVTFAKKKLSGDGSSSPMVSGRVRVRPHPDEMAAGALRSPLTGRGQPVALTGASSTKGSLSRPRRNSGGYGSVASGRTGSSVNLSRSIASARDVLEPEIRRIRFTYCSLMLWIVCLAIGVGVWTESAWTRLLNVTEGVHLAGERSSSLADGVAALQGLVAINDGVDEKQLPFSADIYSHILTEDAEHLSHANELLFLLAESGGPDAFIFDSKDQIAVVDPATGEILLRSVNSLSQTAASTLFRLSEQWMNTTSTNEDVHELIKIADSLEEYLKESLEIRHKDMIDASLRQRLELVVGGSVIMFVAVVVSMILVVFSVRSLSVRTIDILSTYLLVPQSLSKAIWSRSTAMLNRVLAEADSADDNENEDGELPDDLEEQQQELVIEEERAEERVEMAIRMAVAHFRSTNREETSDSLNMDFVATHSDQEDPAKPFYREATRTSAFLCWDVAKLILPVLSVFLYLVAVAMWQSVENEAVVTRANRNVLLERSLTDIVRVDMHLVAGLVGFNDSARLPNLHHLFKTDDSIIDDLDVAVYGGHAKSGDDVDVIIPPMPDSDSLQYRILANDACAGYGQGEERSACLAFGHKLFSHGLISAVETIVKTAGRLANQGISGAAFANNSAITDHIPTLSPTSVAQLSLVGNSVDPFLRDAYQQAIASLAHEMTVEARNTIQGISALTWVFAAFFCLICILYYLPLVNKLAGPLRAAQRLLLLLPSDVLIGIPLIRNRLRKIATDIQVRARTG